MKPCPYKAVISDYQRHYLTWIINNICTNHCRYCPEYLHAGKNHHYQWAEAEQFIDQLLEQHPMVHLVISGGEPTVSPFLPQLLKKFAHPEHYVGVSSNGVRKPEYWDGLDVENLGLSYHPSFHEDNWIKKADTARQYVKQVTVHLMMDPNYWDHCLIIHDQMQQDAEFSVVPTMIVDWGTDYQAHYTPDQLQWFLDNPALYRNTWNDPLMLRHSDIVNNQDQSALPNTQTWALELINRRENNFSGWQCDIGIRSTFVQFDGSWRRGNCEQGGYQGWIRDGYRPANTPVVCGYTECQCLTDIVIPKRRQNSPIWRIR